MLQLSRHPAHLARAANVVAATDITGFGLLGHLWEMVSRSSVSAQLNASAVPLLPGALEASALGAHTGGEGRNRDWIGTSVTIAADVSPDLAALLFDPQTSGGLLLACPADRAPDMESSFRRDSQPLWRIGRVTSGQPHIDVIR
jgi:selenide, water dikinase